MSEDVYGYSIPVVREQRVKEQTILLVPDDRYYAGIETILINGTLENVWINKGNNPYVDFSLSWRGRIILIVRALQEDKVFFPSHFNHSYNGDTFTKNHSEKWTVNGALLLEVIAKEPVEVVLQWQ